jgi:hypothetical protein
MSLKASTWAWSVPAGGKAGISPSLKLLLVALADFADDAGRCWPSVPRLAAMTGLGDRSVRRLLPDLVASGLVAMEHQQGRNTRYRLHIGASAEPLPPRQGCHTGRGVNGTPVKLAPLPMTPETPATRAPEPLRTTSRVEPPFSPPQPSNEKTALPDWVPSVEWGMWDAFRQSLPGNRWTPMVRNLSLASLDALRREGNDPAAVIRQAIAGGYTGFIALPRPKASGRVETFSGYWAKQRAAGMLDADDFADLVVPAKPQRRLDS